MLEKLNSWLRERRARLLWLVPILAGVVACVAYVVDANREPPRGADGVGLACLMTSAGFCLEEDGGIGPDGLVCLFKCVVWCFAPRDPEAIEAVGEAADVMMGSGEGINEGTEEGSR